MPNAMVTLTIDRAESLVALNPGGTSNPFFTASIGAQCVTTPVVNKTLNPVYKATFTFLNCPLPAMVTLRAFNKIPYVDVEDPLGTATLTLFDMQPETTTVVQLSHGGVAALAQRAPNGCGAVTIAYSVVPMPQEAAAPAVGEHSASRLSSLPSYTAEQLLTPATFTPIPVPAAPNIDGNGAASIPVAYPPCEDRSSTAGPVANESTSKLLPSNPSITNPPAATVRLTPVQSMTPAVVEGSLVSASRCSLSQLQSNQQLTPPNIAPVPVPASATFFVPQAAPAPPLPAATNMALKAEPMSGYDSGAVLPAERPQPMPAEEVAAAAAALQLSPPTSESYYANNTVHSAAAAPPVSPAHAQLPSSLAVLPVATTAPVATRFASLQESTSPALSFDAQQQAASASFLYTSAAQAPATMPQTKLLVVPPNINGAPTPTFFHASKPLSCEGSPLPSAAQLSKESPVAVFPTHAPPLVSAGALPVATVPFSPPLSASTTASLCSTPATLSSHRHHNATAVSVNPFPVEAAAPHSAPSLTSAVTTRRGVYLASATAGLQPSAAGAGAAFPNSSSGCGTCASTSAAGNSTSSPGRSVPRTETPHRSVATAITSAGQLYADKQYLFEVAVNGADLEIFQRLRQVDPDLTNGFLQCLDYSGRSLLHIAAWNGQLRVMQVLLSPELTQPMIDLRSVVTAKSGDTILHAAACGGQAEVAQWLRYSHPTAGPLLLSMHNARGMTAAECAMEAGFPQVARLLMPN
ncbi:hypothetical protein JKF63_07141 [Porcisia hertigi]|uniref:C2 domain-containing protein n=1 Tax=Porcisia hertigi TaxID=2761500 RepID=A0A836YHF8_9TRYP|nr:hypothetical protein JKF63_07141 [Porcisia hertigi]